MRSSRFGFSVALVVLVAACSSSIADQPAEAPPPPPEHPLSIGGALHPALRVPESIRSEHERLHAALTDATRAPGAVGGAARELAGALHHHFAREEEIALPPLGLLAPLAAGDFSPQMQGVLRMTDDLREELPRMHREHAQIAADARRLQRASEEAGDRHAAALARGLLAHLESEEELFYPAALLVGEVVRARAAQQMLPPGAP